MSERVEQRDLNVPSIPPVPRGERCCTWSVMIPTYNTAPAYLNEALTSVLQQDPGPEAMQITVVDDASTQGDTRAVVARVGRGRINYHRHERNLGQARTLNRCVELAVGQLVHLLHGDDHVLPGFYAAVAAAAETHPDAGLIACRSRFIDEKGVPNGVSPKLPDLEGGGCDVSTFFYETPVQTPAVVVRRRSYEQVGGFSPAFNYAVDSEMWTRVIVRCSGVVLPEVLACYRIHPSNLSHRVSREGTTVRETERLNALFADRFPGFSRHRGRRRAAKMAWSLYQHFRSVGDEQAARVNHRLWLDTAPLGLRIRYKLKSLARLG